MKIILRKHEWDSFEVGDIIVSNLRNGKAVKIRKINDKEIYINKEDLVYVKDFMYMSKCVYDYSSHINRLYHEELIYDLEVKTIY